MKKTSSQPAKSLHKLRCQFPTFNLKKKMQCRGQRTHSHAHNCTNKKWNTHEKGRRFSYLFEKIFWPAASFVNAGKTKEMEGASKFHARNVGSSFIDSRVPLRIIIYGNNSCEVLQDSLPCRQIGFRPTFSDFLSLANEGVHYCDELRKICKICLYGPPHWY